MLSISPNEEFELDHELWILSCERVILVSYLKPIDERLFAKCKYVLYPIGKHSINLNFNGFNSP